VFPRRSWEQPLQALLHPPAAQPDMMSPTASHCACSMLLSLCHTVPSVFCQQPCAGAQEKARRRGVPPWPSPAWPDGQHGGANATAAAGQPGAQTPSLPRRRPWQAAGRGRRGDRQLLLLRSSPGPGQWPWWSSRCHGDRGGHHCRHPPWGQQGSQMGQEGRGFI